MLSGSVARRYAKAIFDIGIEQNTIIGLEREIARVAEVWNESDDLRMSLTNPLIKEADQRAIWEQTLAKLSLTPLGKNFFRLLLDKGRLEYLPAIAYELAMLIDRKENRLRADVKSAGPLDDHTVNKLKAALQRQTGKAVIVKAETDPSLIGGVVTKIGDLMIDGSIRTRLKRVRETMLEAN